MDRTTTALSAADIIVLLDLKPHPEGGHFRETFRDDTPVSADIPCSGGPSSGVPGPGIPHPGASGPGIPHPGASGPGALAGAGRRQREGARAASTAIYFLLARGQRSHWHRIDAVEIWHHYAGAPLSLPFRRARAARLRGCASAPISLPANARKPWCRLMPGRPPRASAIGRSPAVRWRRGLNSPVLKWHRRNGCRKGNSAVRATQRHIAVNMADADH